jgi:hypothetical protein
LEAAPDLIFDCGIKIFFSPSNLRQLLAIISKIKDLREKLQIPSSKSADGAYESVLELGAFPVTRDWLSFSFSVFHRDGSSIFHLRGKTYGNVFGGSG